MIFKQLFSWLRSIYQAPTRQESQTKTKRSQDQPNRLNSLYHKLSFRANKHNLNHRMFICTENNFMGMPHSVGRCPTDSLRSVILTSGFAGILRTAHAHKPVEKNLSCILKSAKRINRQAQFLFFSLCHTVFGRRKSILDR